MTDGYGYLKRPDQAGRKAGEQKPKLSPTGARRGAPTDPGVTTIPQDGVPRNNVPRRNEGRGVALAARETNYLHAGVDNPDPGNPIPVLVEGAWTLEDAIAPTPDLWQMNGVWSHHGTTIAVALLYDDGSFDFSPGCFRSVNGGQSFTQIALPAFPEDSESDFQFASADVVYYDVARELWIIGGSCRISYEPFEEGVFDEIVMHQMAWSDDDGLTWNLGTMPAIPPLTEVEENDQVQCIDKDPVSGDVIAAGNGGFPGHRSVDGKVWTAVPDSVADLSLTGLIFAASPTLGILAALENIYNTTIKRSANVEDFTEVAITGLGADFLFPFPIHGGNNTEIGVRAMAWAAFLGRFFGVGQNEDSFSPGTKGWWLSSNEDATAWAAVEHAITTIASIVSAESIGRLIAVAHEGTEAIVSADGVTLNIVAQPDETWSFVTWDEVNLRAIGIGQEGQVMTKQFSYV